MENHRLFNTSIFVFDETLRQARDTVHLKLKVNKVRWNLEYKIKYEMENFKNGYLLHICGMLVDYIVLV